MDSEKENKGLTKLMKRKIIQIDEEKCNGCGACASACHESAIEMVNGKAKLVRDDYCDGMGDCLPHCPTGAITFVEREAAPYDEAAVAARKDRSAQEVPRAGCPGSRMRRMERKASAPDPLEKQTSELSQWPCQIRLMPVQAPYYRGARLLIAADCTAYAYASFHRDFLRGSVCVVGCPKLDDTDYGEKLTEILKNNEIESVTVVRMEVPCCGGLERAAKIALRNCGKIIPSKVVTLSVEGEILD